MQTDLFTDRGDSKDVGARNFALDLVYQRPKENKRLRIFCLRCYPDKADYRRDLIKSKKRIMRQLDLAKFIERQRMLTMSVCALLSDR